MLTLRFTDTEPALSDVAVNDDDEQCDTDALSASLNESPPPDT